MTSLLDSFNKERTSSNKKKERLKDYFGKVSKLQNDIKNNINTNKDSTAAIYAIKTVGSIVENEEWEEKEIKTVESLEWNAIVISKDWFLITNKHVVTSNEKTSYRAELQWQSYPIDKIRLSWLTIHAPTCVFGSLLLNALNLADAMKYSSLLK